MKIKIDFDDDQLDDILCAKLKSLMKLLQDDLKRRKDGTGMAIFDTDLDTDVKIMKDHIKAFKTVLKFYG
jgi:predicted glutamine amidotransferase